jgi:hypothetical protein
LQLRRRSTGEPAEHVVAGWLAATAESAERRLADVSALAAQLGSREDLRAFRRPAVGVGDLRLVLHAFPLDATLPGLVSASDPATLVEMLGPVLTSSVPGLLLQGCSAEVVRYGRGGCVLRYELAWELPRSRRALKQVLYGTVYPDDRGRLVGPAVTALRQGEEGSHAPLPFVVPRFRAYLPDLRLALLDAVPGSPLLPSLIRSPAAPGSPGPASVPDDAVAACARVAAALHASAVPVGAARTLTDEVREAHAAVAALAPLAPALAGSLRGHLRPLDGLLPDLPGWAAVSHGDFRPSRVLFDGPTTSLVDFDTVCRAEPALDLGVFTAHLAVSVGETGARTGTSRSDAEDLEGAFLRHYLRLSGSDPGVLLPRVAAHRTVALARLAVRRWCRLETDRLRPVLSALDRQRSDDAA